MGLNLFSLFSEKVDYWLVCDTADDGNKKETESILLYCNLQSSCCLKFECGDGISSRQFNYSI